MSLDKVGSIFKELGGCEAWSLQLLRIINSARDGVKYSTMEIHLNPVDELKKLASDISTHYTDGRRAKMMNYNKVEDYDGTAEGTTIYKLKSDNPLISEPYSRLMESVSNPDLEGNPFDMQMHAYVLKGIIKIDGKEACVTLVSMQNPVTTIRNRFFYNENVFVPINSSVLHLRRDIDVIIVENTVYLLTMAGEKLFHMEHAYKNICISKIENIEEEDIVSNFGVFSKVASSGPHPRMFVSFDEERYQKMKDSVERIKFAERFQIPVKDGKIDTSEEINAKRLVKLLCKKGMVDPFADQPVEVSSARKW